MKENKSSESLDKLDDIIKKNPNNIEFYTFFAKASFQLGTLDRGLNCLQKATDQLDNYTLYNDPKNSSAFWEVYGDLYNKKKMYKDAIRCYNVALKLNTENSEMLYSMAVANAGDGDYNSACSYCVKAAIIELDNQDLWEFIGYLTFHPQCGRQGVNTVINYIENAIRNDPRVKRSQMKKLLKMLKNLIKNKTS